MLAIRWLYPAYILPHYTFADGMFFCAGLYNLLTIFTLVWHGRNTIFPRNLEIIIAKSFYPDKVLA